MEPSLNLGLPLGRVRFRLIRRVLVKLLWPILQNQVGVNTSFAATQDFIIGEINGMRPRLDRIQGDLEHHSSVLSRHEQNLNEIDPLRVELNRIRGDFSLLAERIELAQRQAFARHQDGMGSLRGDMAELAQKLEDIAKLQSQIADIRIRLASADLFVQEVKKSRPEFPSAEQVKQLPSSFDTLYGAFEDAFRGSEDTIKERVQNYVHDIAAVNSDGPVLDIGSGRGELLQVLGAAGISAYGVEINQAYAKRCQDKGLDVRLDDALSHLKSLPEGSLRAVTAIQVVEHIAMNDLIELIDRTVAALAPGGVLIFETPNPENLTVGASSFYIDPTHERPIPPSLLAFLVECRGMVDVEVRRLNRPELEMLTYPTEDNPWNADVAKLINVINTRIYGAQDYAVVARRP